MPLTDAQQEELNNLKQVKAGIIRQYGKYHYDVGLASVYEPRIAELERLAGATAAAPSQRQSQTRTPPRRPAPPTPPTPTPPAPPPPAPAPATTSVNTLPPTSISPYIASEESFHPKIQYELIRRTKSSEMADVYMPFVKLTSLSNVLGDNLATGRRCEIGDTAFPSLGIHGETEISFDDIFTPTTGNRSIIGYANGIVTTNVQLPGLEDSTPIPGIGRVPVLVTSADAVNDPTNIPMPGITKVSTERTTAGPMGVRGGLFRATLDIKAYSTGQVNALLRYFLRPATRVVLELGHRRASQPNTATGFFNWNRSRTDIDAELKTLVTLQESQKKFIEKYIYGNFGNYEIYIGYVVDFKLKFSKDNTYDISLIIHSLQQFEVPTASTGIQSVNEGSAVPDKCKTIEVKDYFQPSSGFRGNSFTQLMKDVTSDKSLEFQFKPITGDSWKDHVIPLRGPGSSPGAGGNEHPGYLVSWQFFVDVILNDIKFGILSVFQLEPDSQTMSYLRAAVIRRIGNYRSTSMDQYGNVSVDPRISLQSNEVGWSQYLRSTRPDVMVIYNKSIDGGDDASDSAIEVASKLERLGTVGEEEATKIEQSFRSNSVVKQAIKSAPIGAFTETQQLTVRGGPVSLGLGLGLSGTGTGRLTNGVWLNTNAIIQAFTGADTITVAIDNLLKEMNNATKGFWNLQLLSNDTESPGLHIIDMGLSKEIKVPNRLSSKEILDKGILESTDDENTISADLQKLGTEESGVWRPKYLYLFNRGLRTNNEYDTGGELLDISLESSLPQVIAVQAIAGVGGQMQRGALQAIDINELRLITAYNVYPECKKSNDGPCADPNDNNTVPLPSGMPAGTAATIRNLIQNGSRTSTTTITQSLTRAAESYVGVCNQEDAAQRTRCEEQQKIKQQRLDEYIGKLRAVIVEQEEIAKPGYLSMVGKYGSMFGSVLDLIEYDLSKLAQLLDTESKVQPVHPFNSSNLTKTTVDLTMPGLGGLQLFQAFGVDRAPNILDRGYYVVTKIAHEFDTGTGWITKVQGRFRYNPNLTSENTSLPCRDIPGVCPEPVTRVTGGSTGNPVSSPRIPQSGARRSAAATTSTAPRFGPVTNNPTSRSPWFRSPFNPLNNPLNNPFNKP